MGNLQPLVGGLKTHDIAADPAKALVDPMFLPAVGHKLHADANAEERPALADHGLLKRVFHARKRAQRRRALAERAHSGKDDAVCGSHLFRSEEHTSELQSLIRISYAVFCLKKKK